jgi:hypothetical protein
VEDSIPKNNDMFSFKYSRNKVAATIFCLMVLCGDINIELTNDYAYLGLILSEFLDFNLTLPSLLIGP